MGTPNNKIWQQQTPLPGRMASQTSEAFDLSEIIQKLGKSVDVFNQLTVAEYTPIVERKPLPNASAIRDRIISSGGSVTTETGETKLDGTLGKIELYTKKHGRYLPGTVGLAGIGVRIPDSSVGTNYQFGYGGDDGNRTGMEIANGQHYTFIESAGNRYYRKPRAEWLDPLDGTGPSGDTVNIDQAVLRIYIGWYGYLSIEWNLAVPSKTGDKIYVIDRSGGEGAENGVSLEQPDLPVFAETDGGVMFVGGRQYGLFGRYTPNFRTTTSPIMTTNITGDYTPLQSFTVKDLTQFRGVPCKLLNASVLATVNSEVSLFIDTTLVGSNFGAIPEVPETETAMSLDVSSTSMSGGYRAYTLIAVGDAGGKSKGDLISADIPDIDLPVGSVVTLAARTIDGSASTIQSVLRITEEW